MAKRVDIDNPKNKYCFHCECYDSSLENNCRLRNEKKHYWNRCKEFQWKQEYLELAVPHQGYRYVKCRSCGRVFVVPEERCTDYICFDCEDLQRDKGSEKMADREKTIEEVKHLQGVTTLRYLNNPEERLKFHKTMDSVLELLKEQEKEIKALRLLVEWAEECDFGYDQFPDEYNRYKEEIKDMNYIEGMIHVAKRTLEDHGAFEEGR